jgi:hypothetical protein
MDRYLMVFCGCQKKAPKDSVTGPGKMINLPRHLVNDIAEFDSEDSIDEYDSIS